MSEEKQDTEQPEDSNDTADGVRQDSPEDEAAVSFTEEQLAEIEMMKQMGLPVSFFEANKLLDKDKKAKVGLHLLYCKNFIFAKIVSIQHSHTMLFFYDKDQLKTLIYITIHTLMTKRCIQNHKIWSTQCFMLMMIMIMNKELTVLLQTSSLNQPAPCCRGLPNALFIAPAYSRVRYRSSTFCPFIHLSRIGVE